MLRPAVGPGPPTSTSGRFRVHLVRLSRHRSIEPARPPASATTHESVEAELHVFAEPGLVAYPIGPVVLDEAVDDRGRDLRPDPPIGPALQAGSGRLASRKAAAPGLFSMSIPLKAEAEPGGRLRRLKGHVPISIITRAGDPIIVPLDDAEGKTSSKGGIAVSVAGVRRIGEDVSFTLRIHGEKAASHSPRAWRSL